MNSEMKALYEISTPRVKDEIGEIVGDFGEKAAIKCYKKYIFNRDDMGIYDYSRSSRANPFTGDRFLSERRKHFLPYDYCIVQDTLLEGSAGTKTWYVEVKSRLFSQNNYTFQIPLSKWKIYLEKSDEVDYFIFLFANMETGSIMVCDINSKHFRPREDGVFINTFHLIPLGDEYRISPKKIEECHKEVCKKLKCRQRSLPGM